MATRRKGLRGYAAVLGIFVLACGESSTATAPRLTSASSASSWSASGKVLYDITFSGDITGGSVTPIAFNTANPWQNVAMSAVLTLPATLDLAGCGADGTAWDGNAGTWAAPLGISKGTSGSFTHLGFQVKDGKKVTLNLTVNSDATSSSPEGAFILEFTDAVALLGMSSPDPTADPCVTFTVTAKPHL